MHLRVEFGSSEDKQLARNIGVSTFPPNPSDPDVLIATIEELVNQYSWGVQPSQDGWLDSYVDKRLHQIIVDKLIAKTQQPDKTRNTLAKLLNNLPGMVYRCNNDANWTMRFSVAEVKSSPVIPQVNLPEARG